MRLPNVSTALRATLLATSLGLAGGCALEADASTEQFELGNDGPADAATLGYNINHFSLNVNDLEAAMHFYGKVLGMRHIYTFHISPILDHVYLGYSVGGKNGTGFQTGEELYNQRFNTAGLLELNHHKEACSGTEPNGTLPASTRTSNTFSHVGLIVPDILATQKRMEEYNITITKRVGRRAPKRGGLANAFAIGDISDIEAEEVVDGLERMQFNFVLTVEDPDGNVVEIIPQA